MAEEDDPPLPPPRKKKKRKNEPARVTSRFRGVWIAVAGLYLATVWLDGVGSNFPARLAPRFWIYFSQIAALFVTAAPKVIDYRAEGWSCTERRWTEIDVRPYFRIDRDNKENRFQRALQFYRKNRVVMRALEDYVIRRYNEQHEVPIAGVRFSSLRIAYPAPGEHVAPFERRPLPTYSAEERHAWYWTTSARRESTCGPRSVPAEPDDRSEQPGPRDSRTDTEKETDP
ncbi:MAG: hypothetical protein JWP97_843 [Labilithrix sp.]|nr:hypothetical protein [Labilithrix sp.]